MAQFTNQAQLSYNNMTVSSNVAVGEIIDALAASKTAVVETYSAGDRVTYVVSLNNSDAAPLTGLTVTDDLGGYPFAADTVYPLSYVENSLRVYIDGVLQTVQPTVTAGPPLTVSDITIPAGSNIMLIYEADVNEFAPLSAGGTVTNNAVVTGDGLASPITASETIFTSAEPELTITKSIEPIPVADNGVLTYTFVIQNYGNTEADAADNISVTDTFDPALSNLNVTVNGAQLAATTSYTYTGNTFTTVPGAITVPAATYTQNPTTGAWSVVPGTTRLVVSGTV